MVPDPDPAIYVIDLHDYYFNPARVKHASIHVRKDSSPRRKFLRYLIKTIRSRKRNSDLLLRGAGAERIIYGSATLLKRFEGITVQSLILNLIFKFAIALCSTCLHCLSASLNPSQRLMSVWVWAHWIKFLISQAQGPATEKTKV
jgi:hypothetical protein